ncbi:cellulose binding domain-containing protein [Actinosynnema sp. NPDC059797]
MADRWYPALTAALGGAPTTTTTTTTTATVPPVGNCSALYRVTSQWNGGFQGEVVVRNNTSATTATWTATLTFADGQRLNQAWNATATQDGPAVTARGLGWNGALPPGGSATFGFLATGTGAGAAVSCTTG